MARTRKRATKLNLFFIYYYYSIYFFICRYNPERILQGKVVKINNLKHYSDLKQPLYSSILHLFDHGFFSLEGFRGIVLHTSPFYLTF